jgi:uroporphyrinogen decarboxylase
MEVATACEINRVHAVADKSLSPVILIPEDFSTKGGPIFSPAFLEACHYPYVKRLAAAWHEHDITVLYHSDGNYKAALEGLMKCGVDGFYCLEPACGMDIVEFKNKYPAMVWAGGVDGVDLMERGKPNDVRSQVHEHILQTNALEHGGMFVASSSEINPPVKPENFKAMVEAVGELYNAAF